MAQPRPIPTSAITTKEAPILAIKGDRLAGLDGLRGLAILLVLMNNMYDGPASQRLDGVVLHAFKSGYVGVDLFFVLSGFLITGILYSTRGDDRYFRNFYARRFLRIFPLYYGFLALWLFLVPRLGVFTNAEAHALSERQWWYWTYLANVNVGLELGPAGAEPRHFWSLAVEEQFYLVWPLIVAVASRRRLIQICAGLVAAAALLRTFWLYLAPTQLTHQLVYTLTAARMDSLALGALVALLIRSVRGRETLLRWAPRVGIAGCAVLGAIFVWQRGLRGAWFSAVGFTVVALVAASAIVLSVTRPDDAGINRVLAWPLLRRLGQYSYGIYVLHGSLFAVAVRLGLPHELALLFGSPLAAALGRWLVLALASVGLAALSWHAYEVHWLRLKRFFPYARRVVPPPP
ncbi:MAG TPA: acyltransferase [Gemmatimonadales bacterium]|nr:acyltransferase [Gemmatimonadales bacterium]